MATEKRNELKEIMQRAWLIIRAYGWSMAEALRQAWAVSRLKAAMRKGVAAFRFTKKDGSTREAMGTLDASLIPTHNEPAAPKAMTTAVCYWDMAKAAFRSFNVCNLITE